MQFIGTAKVQAKEHLSIQADTLDNASLRIQSNGNLTVKAVSFTGTGTLSAALDLSAKFEEDYTHKNQLNAGRHLSISTTKHLINQGTIQAQGEITLEAKVLENPSKSLIDGVYLTFKTKDLLKNDGVIQGSAVVINTQRLINDGTNNTEEHQAGAILARRHMTIKAQSLHNQAHGLVRSDGELTIGDALVGTQCKVTDSTQEFVNSGSSTIESKERLSIQVGQLDNQKGQITANSDFILNSHVILNQEGRIDAKGDQSVLEVCATAIDNTSGWLINAGTGKTHIIVHETINNFNTKAIKGAGIIFGKGPVTIHSPKVVNYEGGAIISDQVLKIKTPYLGSQLSTLSAGQKIEIDADKLYNVGSLIAVGEDEKFKVEASHSVQGLSRCTTQVGVLEVRAGEMVSTSYKGEKVQNTLIRVHGKIIIKAQNIYNANKTQILGQHVDLNAEKLFSNSDSNISVSDAFTLTAERFINAHGGGVQSQGDILLKAKELENKAGSLIDGVCLTLKAEDSLRNHGVIQGDSIAIDAKSLVNDGTNNAEEHQAGAILARHHLTIKAQSLHNQEHGLIRSDGELTIGDALVGTQCKVIDSTQKFVNSGSSTIESKERLSIQVGQLDNQKGQITANSDLILNSRVILNREGRIEAKGDQSVLEVCATAIDNTSGWLINAGTGKTLIIAHETINNFNTKAIKGAGLIFGKGPVTIHSPKVVNYEGGAIISDQVLKIKSPYLGSQLSTLSAGQRIEIDTDQLTNVGGLIAVGDDEKLKTATSHGVKDLSRYTTQVGVLEVRAGEMVSTSYKGEKVQNTLIRVHGKIIIKAQNIYNANKTQILGQHVDLNAEKLFSNSDSNISVSDALMLTAERFINAHGGGVQSQGDILLKAKELENKAGSLIDGVCLTLKAEDSLRNHGVIQGDSIAIDAKSLVNDGTNNAEEHQAGAILARHHLTIKAQSLHNQEHGLIRSDGELTIGDALVGTQCKVTDSTQKFVNSGSSTIESKERLSIQVGQLDNQKGQITANSDFILNSHVILNREGRIEAKGDQSVLEVCATAIDNTSGWLINAGTGKTHIIAHETINNFNTEAIKGAGLIFGKGPVTIHSPKVVNYEGGAIISDQVLKIKSPYLGSQLSTLSAGQRIEIDTDKLTNVGGLIAVGDDEKLKMATSHGVKDLSRYTTQVGVLEVRAGEMVSTSYKGEKVQNTLIRVQGKIIIKAQNIYNTNKTQILGQHVDLNAEKLFSNSDSNISVSDALMLTAERFINAHGGGVQSQGDILFKVKELENQAGALIDGRFLTLILQNQLKNSGVIQGSTITICVQNLINDGANDTNEQRAGAIIARRHLTIGAQTLRNQEHGLLHSDGDLTIGDTLDASHKVKGF
ncbi:hypothetical protein [Mycoavidus cysteinexigens]|uniref:hypothetical protein n=1 Tax=Mycoavidus cysteinexigens TaxID=1553431 RepID=UPI0013763011|nr:hypothetical protein [Mycoavidus cysteinexigens]